MHLQWKVRCFLCYGDEENARIYAVHLTTANQSEIREDVHCIFVSVIMKKVNLFTNLYVPVPRRKGQQYQDRYDCRSLYR